jgi:nitroimidazol reductase NimA-like FMN-containing flavoprotein (pyridoxamine 5'-phosphate oxidase superfamily)
VCHGSTGSRLFRTLAQGAPACLAVTIVDGLILARSAFEHSMRYRSALVLGRAEAVVDEAAKLAALRRISDHLVPGRWAQVRQPNEKELAATLVVRLPLDECSVKVSAGSPQDAAEDLDFPVWAGVVPISTSYGEPEPEPGVSLPPPRLP